MKTAAIILATAAAASAHSTWQQLWVGSTDKGTTCTRTVANNNPIASLTSSDMFCGIGPKASTGVCEVAGTFLSLSFIFYRSWVGFCGNRREAVSQMKFG